MSKFKMSFTGSNHLKVDPQMELSGVLDFDGSTYVEVSAVPDMTGTKTYKFKTFFGDDCLSETNAQAILLFSVAFNERFHILFYTTTNEVVILTQNDQFTANLSSNSIDFDNKILRWEILTTNEDITSVKINNITLSGTTESGTSMIENRSYIGCGWFTYSDVYKGNIWDLEIVGQNKWIGMPSGNLDSAWVDTIGSLDCSVGTDPSSHTASSETIIFRVGTPNHLKITNS